MEYVQVKGRIGNVANGEAHAAKAFENVVTLVLSGQALTNLSCYHSEGKERESMRSTSQIYTNPEMRLQTDHLVLDEGGVKHGNGSLLEGVVGAPVEVATARTDAVRVLAIKNMFACQLLG